ncbi:Suppressor of the cold-sensitive snRNP bioproteinsis mutant brr1-1, partial [Perkinsus olseni]
SALLQVSAMVARIALQAPRNREDGVGNWWLMAEAMDMALDIGVDIVSISIFGELSKRSSNWILGKAFRAATDQDIILVACAGNHGKAADTYYPCALPGVVCVASLDMQDPLRVSSFSNYGNSVDIAAYGSGVYTGSGQYASGTSSSCPLVSGAAAILLAMGVKPEYVAGMLTYNVDRFASPLRPLKKHAGALNPLKAVRMAIDFPVLRGAR